MASSSSITSLVSVKLNRDNYLMWRSQLESVMISQDLMKFVDGSSEAPSEMIARNDKDELNPEFATWRKSDQLVLSWIKATVFEAVLGQIIRTHLAQEAWVALEKSYGSPSPLRVMLLKKELMFIKKDTGATNNIVASGDNLENKQTYSGSESVMDEMKAFIVSSSPLPCLTWEEGRGGQFHAQFERPSELRQ
ncbi:hypothetical protein EJ110_NYTH11111 [Nymphaea thermarum]|nr:hypothetical protein EJ110_NYTH11111 [Nymphaea thermarum]